MGTIIRPELSKKNKYWIDKNRYYELKYFCLQYPFWKKAYAAIDGFSKHSLEIIGIQPGLHSDPTARCVEAKELYLRKISTVEQAAIEADAELYVYILQAVTEGLSYEMLKVRLEIPCSRDTFYDRYRKFFWLLNKARE